MEPICSVPPFSRPLPPPLLTLSLSLLNPPTKPLLLVSDFYLVAPGPRFISRSPLHSPSTFFPLSPLPAFVPSLAIAYQQPAASNSPELLIPDFKPVGKALTPFLLVLLPTPLSSVSPQSLCSHRLVPLIGGGLISRTTSVKVDNRASTRAATLCTATKTRTTFLFVQTVSSYRIPRNSRTNSIQPWVLNSYG